MLSRIFSFTCISLNVVVIVMQNVEVFKFLSDVHIVSYKPNPTVEDWMQVARFIAHYENGKFFVPDFKKALIDTCLADQKPPELDASCLIIFGNTLQNAMNQEIIEKEVKHAVAFLLHVGAGVPPFNARLAVFMQQVHEHDGPSFLPINVAFQVCQASEMAAKAKAEEIARMIAAYRQEGFPQVGEHEYKIEEACKHITSSHDHSG